MDTNDGVNVLFLVELASQNWRQFLNRETSNLVRRLEQCSIWRNQLVSTQSK